MKFLITFLLNMIVAVVFSQTAIMVEVSADTIRPGEMVEVVYTIENGEGKFEAPDLMGLPLISGPNISSSFMIQNGAKSSSQSYTYIFKPKEEKNITVPEAAYHENGKSQVIEAVTVIVNSKFNSIHAVGTLQQNQSSKKIREKKKF